jgi:hypothetical protein
VFYAEKAIIITKLNPTNVYDAAVPHIGACYPRNRTPRASRNFAEE